MYHTYLLHSYLPFLVGGNPFHGYLMKHVSSLSMMV